MDSTPSVPWIDEEAGYRPELCTHGDDAPPHDCAAERGLIAYVLRKQAPFAVIGLRLNPDTLYDFGYRRLWGILTRLALTGKHATLDAVYDLTGQTEDLVALSAISLLADFDPESGLRIDQTYLAAEVKDCAHRRELVRDHMDAARDAYNRERPIPVTVREMRTPRAPSLMEILRSVDEAA